MRKEITRQVAKALTARDKDDNNEKEEVPMKEKYGHQMRQAAKKKSGTS